MTKAKKKGGSGKKPTKGKSSKQTKQPSKKQEKSIVKTITKTERQPQQITRKAPSHFDVSKETKDFKHVIRISGRDVPGFLTLKEGFSIIYGIGKRASDAVVVAFKKKTNKNIKKIGYLTDDDVVILDNIILNLDKEVPTWLLNRQKSMDGSDKHVVMADLRLENRKDLQRLGKTKSYRGLRLQWGLTVRGQKTKSSFRRGGVVGVTKKK